MQQKNSSPPSSPVRQWQLLAILGLLMGFASISTDFYLPAMPAIRQTFATSAGMVEWTISSYLIGFSLGQLLWGPVSDRYGRLPPVALGLLLFLAGSGGCALSANIDTMILWRIVQALGASACVVLSRAMVRDLHSGARAASILSTLIMIMAIAPLLGPLLGGQILHFAGWRMIFWILVAVGAAALVALRFLPETLPVRQRNPESIGHILRACGQLLHDRTILTCTGTGACLYAGTYAYIAGSPFAYISWFGVPARLYGLLFAAGILGIVAGNFINARLVTRFGIGRVLLAGTSLTATSSVILALMAVTGSGGFWGLTLALFLFVSSNGLVIANSIAGAMESHPRRAGMISGLVGALQYGSGMVGSALAAALADGTPWPMSLVMAICGLGSLLFALRIPMPAPTGAHREGDVREPFSGTLDAA